ncbi:conserved membrane hypothetical protein [metagenome]|uniref:Uncharacterized protein n=1 Tax=metagenome TaxID=256318 RepID=A0A2P2BYQ6_9ZZZZ
MTTVGRQVLGTRQALGAVLALRATQRYAPVRRLLSHRSFRAATAAWRWVQVVGATLAGWAAGAVGAAGLGGRSHGAGLFVAALVAVNAYGMALFALRQLTGTRARLIIHPPDEPMLRALDVPRSALFVATSVLPAVWVTLTLCAGTAAALLAFSAAPWPSWWVLSVPITGALGVIAVSSRQVRRGSAARDGRRREVAIVVLALVAGIVLALGTRFWALGDRVGLNADWLVSPSLGGAATGVALLVSAALSAVVMTGLRRMAECGFEHATAGSARSRRDLSAGRSDTLAAWHRQSRTFTSGPEAVVVASGLRVLLAGGAFLAGAVAAGVRLPETLLRHAVVPASSGVMFVSLLIVVGLLFSALGPTAMLPRLRFEWENSSAGALAVALRSMVYPVAALVVPAVVFATAQSLAAREVVVKALAVAVALVGAAVVAETVVPAREETDNTSTPGTISALVVLILTAPVMAAPSGVVWALVTLSYSLALIGVGGACLARRILHLPLSTAV